MGLFVSTVSGSLSIPELGFTLTHPVTDYDIGGQFGSELISTAITLTAAIRAGTVVWRKTAGGSIQPPTDYDSDFLQVDEENVGPGQQDDRSVTFKDLNLQAAGMQKAGYKAPADFTGTPRKATVTFATVAPNANYSVAIGGATDGRSWLVESQTAAGFVINSQASAPITGNVYWQIQGNGEFG